MTLLTEFSGLSGRRFLLLLAAVFVVSMGYGVILPLLPFILERQLAEVARASVSWHTGMLTGVYMFALFAFAPLWGRVSDRLGRRPVLLLGLAGFAVALALFALAGNLALAYVARVLGGMFSAAVLPVALADMGDVRSGESRARGFAWISAASALGFLAGPALGGWLSGVSWVMSPAINSLPTGVYALPFMAVAMLGGLVWLGIYFYFSGIVAPPHSTVANPAPDPQPLTRLLVLTLLVMFGLGSFEVSIALQGQQLLKLDPSELGIMFMECSLVMIVAQALIFSPLIKRFGGRPLLAPAFLAMAAGVGLLPYTSNYFLMLLLVGLIAAGSGILVPALTYLVSLAAVLGQGAALGKQTAAASLGQALGSAAGGWLFGILTPAPFWLTGGLLLIAAATGLRTARRAPPSVRVTRE